MDGAGKRRIARPRMGIGDGYRNALFGFAFVIVKGAPKSKITN